MSYARVGRENAEGRNVMTDAKPGPASGLRIGDAHDHYEREAEHIADVVSSGGIPDVKSMTANRVLNRTVQRSCGCGGSGGMEGECEECKQNKLLQRSASGAGSSGVAPRAVHEVLKSPGRPMEATTQKFMETRFGRNFSGVRIFHDDAAAASASAVSANAYTVGEKIVFNRGKYSPGTQGGQRLLAHELTHVVQQSGGGVSPKPSGEPALENEAGQVSRRVNDAGTRLSVRQKSGVGMARDAATSDQKMIEVHFPDGTKLLTPDEFAEYKRRAINNLRADLRRVSGLADNGKQSQESMLAEYQGGVESFSDIWKKPKALIGIAADIKAGVTPPYIGAWSHPKRIAEEGLAACDAGNLAEGARLLKQADSDYRQAINAWNAYREATIGGAEGVASNLETIRDVSFAIALVAGAAVAAPVIAAGAAGLGATGATATVLSAGGTAIVTGAGGAALGGGSTALGSYAATGKVDTKAVKQDAIKFGKQGVVTGLTAGLGSSLTAASTGAKLAQPLVQSAARRCLTEAGVNVAGEVTTQALEAALPDPSAKEKEGAKPALPGPARAALTGCLSGALGVPVAKLGQTGRKASELAVGAGVGYVDARLSGQSNKDALVAAGQNVLTSAAVAHGHAGTEQAKAKAAKAGAGTGTAHAGDPPAKSATEKFLEKQKAAGEHEGTPAVLKEDAKAKKSVGDGHDAVVTDHGVGRCSPSPCPVISVEFAKELKADKKLQRLNSEVEALRKTNPPLAAEKAADLIKSLQKKRRQGAGVRVHDEELGALQHDDAQFAEGDDHNRGRETAKQNDQARAEERDFAQKGIKKTSAREAAQELQQLANSAAAGEYKALSPTRKSALLRKFKTLLKLADARDLPRIKNKMLGDFDEAVRTPNKVLGQPQDKFVAGLPELEGHDLPPGRASYAQPDYSVHVRTESGGRVRAHVNLKAHALEGLSASQATRVARDAAAQAQRNTFHLPEGERIIVSFAETPSKEIQQAMLAELFRPNGPIMQVRFGTTTHNR